MDPKFKTREEWLVAAIELYRPLIKAAGGDLDVNIKVACGWPHTGGCRNKNRVLGECWAQSASADGKTFSVFVSPYVADALAAQGVLEVLGHELCHVADRCLNKHKAPFKKLSKGIGLEGKVTCQVAGEKLLARFSEWLKELGPYPHVGIDKAKADEEAPTKKQSTRMIKLECETCGYAARTTRKWLDEVGPLHCPKHGEMMAHLPKEDNEDGDNED